MSTIYKFQDSESVITSSTSSTGAGGVLQSTDTTLIFNTQTGKTNQIPIGALSGLSRVENISTNTSSSLTVFPTLSPYGTTIMVGLATGASCGLVAVLPAPPQAGLYKTICMGTSTSTGLQVVCPTTVSAIFSTGASSGTFVANQSIFFGQMGGYVDLISLSTSAWLVAGRSVGAIAFTTTTTT